MAVTVMICVDGEDSARWSPLNTWVKYAPAADLAAVVAQVSALLTTLQTACSATQKAELAKASYPEKATAIDAAAVK